jgi:hypothetical protein
MIHTSTLEYIVALRELQPATADLVATTLQHNTATSAGRLVEMVRMGLATRRKFDPFKRAPLSADEIRDRRIGIKNNGCKIGKRPYLYELTDAANAAAEHLGEALATLEWEIANNESGHQRAATG